MTPSQLINKSVIITKIADIDDYKGEPVHSKVGDIFRGRVIEFFNVATDNTPGKLILRERKFLLKRNISFYITSFNSADLLFDTESSRYGITII